MKLAIVDRRWIYVGSMNFDQRSAYRNTELGLIIDSPSLAKAVVKRIDTRGVYKVRLSADRSSVEWVAEKQGKVIVETHEPEASLPQRFLVKLLQPFVPEGEF